MKIKISIAQINTYLGDTEANLRKHLEYADKARQAGADLIVFPELSLTGYALQDLAATVSHCPTPEDPIFAPLLEKSKELDLVVGFVDEDRRHRFFIASAYLSGGEVVHVHHKVYLPTYGLFDEGRFFAWGDSIRAFDTRFGRVGIAICEDFWHASPPDVLWVDGADIFILTSASPGRGLTSEPKLESARWVEQINRAYANLFTSFVVHANRVGYEDGLNFWGGSTVFDPNGDLVVQGPYHEEALLITEIDLNQLHRTRARMPLLRDERTELIRRELERVSSGKRRQPAMKDLTINSQLARKILSGFIKSEISRTGFNRALVGLSGGIDSALSCYLAVEALGAQNVLAVRMPYKTSSPDLWAHAGLVIDDLGIQSKDIPITDMVDPLISQFPKMNNIRKGNIMARARMIVLYDQSEAYKGLVVGTSNKTEILLGYSTLYGDSACAINPIGDLYKAQVRQLANDIGVPREIIEKPPSADLWAGQTDEEELGFTYKDADQLLYLLVDQRYSPEDLVEAGFESDFVNTIIKRVRRNQFKRILPPVAKLSNRTIGYDFLYLRDWGT